MRCADCEPIAERGLASDRPARDRVEVNFDWEVPAHANDPLTFLLTVRRGTRRSEVRFQIDLQKPAEADLQRLHEFLVHQHSGVRDDYIFGRGLTMLLTLSLQQQGIAVEQVDNMVRNLLLC
jgi:hypothetical protein